MSKSLRIEEMTYVDLMKLMSKDNIGIPEFQRGFVWKDSQVISLVHSLLNQYPIGAFIVWKTSKDIGMRNMSCDISDRKGKKYLIIDGQQRMLSLYYLSNQEKYSRNKQQFYEIYAGKQKKPIEFERFCLEKNGRHYELVKGGRESAFDVRLFRKIITNNYIFPVIFISTDNLETAKDIFSRVNEQGTKISTEDIFLSKLWDKTIDLGRKLREKRSKLNKKSKNNIFSNLERVVFFHLFSLAIQLNETMKKELELPDTLDIGSKTLNKIAERLSKIKAKRKKRYLSLFNDCLDAIQETLSFMRENLKVSKVGDIPSQTLVTVMSVFFLYKDSPNKSQRKELLKWFWRSSFCNRFTGKNYNENIISDPMLMMRLAKSGHKMNIGYDYVRLEDDDLEIKGRSSVLSAIKLMLWSSNPVWVNGKKIVPEDPERVIKNKDDDHFYPYSICYKKKLYKENPRIINSMLNMVYLPGDVNKNKSNNLLSVFIEENGIEYEYGEEFMQSSFLPFDDVNDLIKSEKYLRTIFEKAQKNRIKQVRSVKDVNKFEKYFNWFINSRKKKFEDGIKRLMRKGNL